MKVGAQILAQDLLLVQVLEQQKELIAQNEALPKLQALQVANWQASGHVDDLPLLGDDALLEALKSFSTGGGQESSSVGPITHTQWHSSRSSQLLYGSPFASGGLGSQVVDAQLPGPLVGLTMSVGGVG